MIFLQRKPGGIINSSLYDQNTFYNAFLRDLASCQKEVIIESPFISYSRMTILLPVFKNLIAKGVNVRIITRDPIEYDGEFKYYATQEILECCELGIKVTLEQGYHHRKLAILDRNILYEGSLNILSQSRSQEIMRRIESEKLTKEMYNFLNLDRLL